MGIPFLNAVLAFVSHSTGVVSRAHLGLSNKKAIDMVRRAILAPENRDCNGINYSSENGGTVFFLPAVHRWSKAVKTWGHVRKICFPAKLENKTARDPKATSKGSFEEACFDERPLCMSGSLTFRASCIRDGDGHGFNSLDVRGELGAALCSEDMFPCWRVDLTDPDLEAVALVSGDTVTLGMWENTITFSLIVVAGRLLVYTGQFANFCHSFRSKP